MPTTVKSRLPEIARELDDRLDAAVRGAAISVALSAKRRVPVRTGDLKRAIHVRRQKQGEYLVVAGDHEAWYGHFVEFGTSASAKRPWSTAPHPFLIPALEMVRPEFEALARTELKNL